MKTKPFLLATLLLLFAISCSKKQDPGPDNSNNNQSGGNTSNGGNNNSTNATINYINASFTIVSITINNQTQSIAPGGKVQYTGIAGTTLTGTATTSGQTVQGTLVGNVITWNLSNVFPASGNLNFTLNVGADSFFLKMQNKSSTSIIRLYVNYQLVSQTLDNITVNNDGLLYGIGYYKAFSNSNVRAESANSYWYWGPVSLPNTQNQSVTLTAD